MPLYKVQCQICHSQDQIWRKVSDRDENLPMCNCGIQMNRVISAPYIAPDITPYVSPGSGKVINSRAQQEYDLKATNSIINEPGLDKDIARNREYRAEESFKPIANGVDNIVRQLVSERKLDA